MKTLSIITLMMEMIILGHPGDYFNDWVGDGYCNDFINIPECNHDGGDCCGDDVNTDYCDDCICHQ